MSPDDTCQDLPRFLDGEMSAEEQARFREHLGGCEQCSEAFRDALQLELLGQMTVEEGPVRMSPDARRARRSGGRWRGRWPWAAGGAALALGLLAALLPLLGGEGVPDGAWLVPPAGRHLEARLTYAPVDQHYRRYVPDRSGVETKARVAALPLHALARLEAREDLHGIATAYLLYGAPRQAMAFLEKMPDSPDRRSDQAVIALEQAREARDGDMDGALLKQGLLDEALELLDGVLREAPDHPQALWNRALVLREMGLSLLAAESFEAVARRAEPGWGDEARSQVRKLRDDTLAREREWKEAHAATRDLMTDPRARLPLDEARRYPGIVRLAFYDVLRAVPTREDVARLLPLAEVLDETYGRQLPDAGIPDGRAGFITQYVKRVAARDFTRRGPAAERYGRLLRGELPATPALLEELRRSGEDDILLGALVYASGMGRPVDLEEVARLADAQGDAWMQFHVERLRAIRDTRAGEWWKAEPRLREALEACWPQSLAYRCLGLERALTDLYLGLHRPAEALRYAWRGWNRAKDAGEWRFEQEFLQELADVARFQHAFASARAYLEEAQARMPVDCAQRTHIQSSLASVEWRSFRPDDARRALDRALACERPLGLTGAFVLAELARSRPQPRDDVHLRRALAELRRPGLSAGTEALLLFIEGQFALARSRTEGEVALWRAIERAEEAPDDVDARKARAYAYGVLIAEEGAAGRWPEALALLGRQLRLGTVPQQCLLAVSLHHERTLVMAQGPYGRLHGSFDDTRARPLNGTEKLVPRHLVEELRDCEHVDVLALPPVHGLTGVLPMDMAWSYRVGRGAMLPPSPEGGAAHHLVVTHVAAPPSLRLPRLDMLEPPRVPDPLRVELRGTLATPSRVLAAMVDASEVELHAHGLFSPAVSDASLVVLALDGDGRYALTADRVRRTRLRQAPLVLLVTCSAARTAPFQHEPFSLPVAFIEAGARLVLASTVDIPDTAGAFFEAVRERIRGGMRPSVALRDTRMRWLKERPGDGKWLGHVLLFE
ncbi:CHAT domain-containing protein [Pyxidicoccus fallax]|uniref:CHAT domain-containing protein n=1 Tax=Pyxidicoccus fallax TaxID=394095 RepID=A0A848LFZ9_9BACT|nr:CHAT domain-containing protein [Pyxidicoccus fallax]NMO17382.1 CHAT domain-containing protein [Pyxidicoccus fallax]NPC77919.1 CHAT domain-containing protein [Pyxidicoccus fallax]